MTSTNTPSAKATAPRTINEHRARLKRLAVDGGEIAYVESGPRDGKVILLLHGVPQGHSAACSTGFSGDRTGPPGLGSK
jgi:Fe-S cluster biogenesis protein NfuA